MLGCSLGTVKRQTFDAFRRIRELAPHLISDDTTIEARCE
jgi:hypothetical protein